MFFKAIGFWRNFLQIFIENERIFVKGIRDFYVVIRPFKVDVRFYDSVKILC